LATLVDSNILIDITSGDVRYLQWSSSAIEFAALEGALVVNQVVWSELAGEFASEASQKSFFNGLGFERRTLPFDAAFRAGRAHLAYRRVGGARFRTLPDFLIGAHAETENLQILTRDASVYRNYFPTVRVVTPDGKSS